MWLSVKHVRIDVYRRRVSRTDLRTRFRAAATTASIMPAARILVLSVPVADVGSTRSRRISMRQIETERRQDGAGWRGAGDEHGVAHIILKFN